VTATAAETRELPTRAEPIIATAGLTKVFKDGLVAVDRVDLTVGRGEFFGLLGPNGAGKTTTIGMLTTRVRPTGGRARVAGCDVAGEPARTKQRIGVVSQTNTLDRSLSAYENLYYHARYFGYGRRRAAALAEAHLEQFRLGDKRDALVDKLSGGLAQRLMIARALMHEPEILFLDEPTVGLDPQSRIALWELLEELNAGGQSILLTTHYMEEADRLCRRVAIMDHGLVLACDHPEELKRTVDAEAVVRVTPAPREPGEEAHPEDVAALAGVLGGVGSVTRVEVRDGAVECFADTARGLLPRLVGAAEQAGLPLGDLSATEPSLETVFVRLTGRDLRE
jgi:ABC-2 type transport system ATP-binding protein